MEAMRRPRCRPWLATIAACIASSVIIESGPAAARVPKGLEICLIESSGPNEQATIRKALYYALSDDPKDVTKAKNLFATAYANLLRLLVLRCKVEVKDLRSPEVGQATNRFYQSISTKLMEEILRRLRSRSQ